MVEIGDGYIEYQSPMSHRSVSEYKYTCRIWLSGECSSDDPLISPCKWSGTMQYIHVEWVKQWLMSRVVIKKSNFYTSMAWEDISWELWKTKFPDYIRIKGDQAVHHDNTVDYDEGDDQIIQLIDLDEENINWPYVMLDCINVASFKKSTSKVVYFIKMSEESVVIGRGQVSNVRLADISISRKHTAFRLTKDKQIYITDEASKFGTLILQQFPVNLMDKRYGSSSIQISFRNTLIK